MPEGDGVRDLAGLEWGYGEIVLRVFVRGGLIQNVWLGAVE